MEDQFSTARIVHYQAIADCATPHVRDAEWQWLVGRLDRIAADPEPSLIARVFTSIPRNLKSVDKQVRISLKAPESLGRNGLPLLVMDWPLVRLLRVWMLMHIPRLEQAAYVQLIERLFAYGEMEELTALYAALPVYHYPDAWHQRCAEGIRSNMGTVRDAVVVGNAYPSAYLSDAEWNQLVLKAFFTDTDIHGIIGLEARNNERLAEALVDYAYELHAAKRPINPMLWKLVAPFMDNRAYTLMESIVRTSQSPGVRKAIVEAFDRSNFAPARKFLNENSELTTL